MHLIFDNKDDHTYEVVTPEGKKHTGRLSYKFLLEQAVLLIDGLSEKEIDALHRQRKLSAVKMYRDRTGECLKECQNAVEGWVERNIDCCKKWPYCPHNPLDVVRTLDLLALEVKQTGPKVMQWKYGGKIDEQTAHAIMAYRGFAVKDVGFFSFQYKDEDEQTVWFSNVPEK